MNGFGQIFGSEKAEEYIVCSRIFETFFVGCTDFSDGSLIPITNPNFIYYIDNNAKDADPLQAFCGTGYDITLNRKAVYVIYDVIEFSLVELSFAFFGAAEVSVALYLENDVIRTYKVRFGRTEQV